MKIAIVDDELLARQILEEYSSKIDTLELVLSTGNSLDFINFIQQQDIDLVFLDIEMPELNGMEILRSMVKAPNIILTTAYSEYALESYDYGVVDYLLKPIKFDRFLKAVNKVSNVKPNQAERNVGRQELQIKHDGIPLNIPLNSIQYIQSFGNYLRIFTDARMYLICKTLTNILTLLPSYFQQSHKSYVVNLKRVKKVTSNLLICDNVDIPLSSTYKMLVLSRIKEQSVASEQFKHIPD